MARGSIIYCHDSMEEEPRRSGTVAMGREREGTAMPIGGDPIIRAHIFRESNFFSIHDSGDVGTRACGGTLRPSNDACMQAACQMASTACIHG